MFKLILVPIDGTTQSNRAVKTAAALATDLGATLIVFHASHTYQSLYYPDGVGMTWPPKTQYEKDASAGRFPKLSSALGGYCGILSRAIEKTMPPNSPGSLQNDPDIKKFVDLCFAAPDATLADLTP